MIADSTSYIPYVTLFALLAAATWVDMRKHRIPNLISLGGVMAGLLINTGLHGLDGFLAALGGLSLAFVIMLPFYLLKGMGAGDVKLMAAVGAFIGSHQVLLAVGLTLCAGSIAGLAILIMQRGIGQTFQRYWLTFKGTVITGRWFYVPPNQDEAAAIRFPYALAIALGTGTALIYLNGFPTL